MKIKISVILAVLLCSWSVGTDAFSQIKVNKKDAYKYKYELRLGWGGYPVIDQLNTFGFSSFSDDIVGPVHYNLTSIYRKYEGPGYLTGTIAAEFDINFKKWFALTVGAGVCGIYKRLYDPVTKKPAGMNSGAAVSILPEAKFNWLNRDIVRMYSAVGLGVTCSVYNEKNYGSTYLSIYPAFQFTPLGIALGRKVYGFAEVGIGTQYMGAMAGVGFRF